MMENISKGEESEVKREETSNFDGKISSDTKSVQARIVRGTKKMRIDSTDLAQVSEKDQKKESKDEESAEAKIVRSLKRSCELWSAEDKNTFFKAINEFGKDFDALQSYFLSQGKKKGLPENMIKNKEQIRHFYYRTWLKISKHLKFSEDVKKATQEIYGLINYGELRRKLPRIHEKVLLKLNELIYWGSTQVRLRGKTMRIKTPICRALRKLNQLEDWQEEIKLPSRVTIELRPGNNMTWWQVQAHAMNPRVRTLLPIQRRLSSLLIFLQQRWRPAKYTTCTNNAESLEQIDSKDRRLLRVSPPDGCKIALPVVNLGEYLTSNSVSFNSYEKRLALKSSRLELLGSVQYIKGVGKKAIKKYKVDKKLPNRGTEDPQLQQQFVPSDSGNIELDSPERNVNIASDKSVTTVGHFNFDLPQPETQTWNEPNRFPGRETIERIRLGWTIDEANTITVGDLFLMFGRESKVSLEYWWDTGELDNEAGISSVDGSKLTRNSGPGQSHDGGSLCLALQKLLSIAKHNYGTSKIYDNTSGSNETVVSSRVPSAKESTFRRPLIPQVYHKIGTQDAFKTQLDKFKSRFCKRGRTVRQRSLIVQRVLPAIASYESTPNTISDKSEQQKDVVPINNEVLSMADPRPDGKNVPSVVTISDGKEFMTALQRQSDNTESTKASNSIITSATQILKEGEHQWLNSEVADFSLSSFLGQLESPIKGSQRSQTGGHPVVEDARPSSDVVSHMQCLMGENSVDYMAKFANLASQIASDGQKKSTPS